MREEREGREGKGKETSIRCVTVTEMRVFED